MWGKVGGGDEGETDDDDARSGKGDEGGITSEGAIRDKEERQRKDKELDELAERILYQVRDTFYQGLDASRRRYINAT